MALARFYPKHPTSGGRGQKLMLKSISLSQPERSKGCRVGGAQVFSPMAPSTPVIP